MADRKNLAVAYRLYERDRTMLESRHLGALVIYDTARNDRAIGIDFVSVLRACHALQWKDKNGAVEGIMFRVPQPALVRSLAECVWFHEHKRPHKLGLLKPAEPVKPARAKRKRTNRRPRS